MQELSTFFTLSAGAARTKPPADALEGPELLAEGLLADDLLQRSSESYGLAVNARGELVLSRGADLGELS